MQRLLDNKCQASIPEVSNLRQENVQLKGLVTDLSLKNVVLKKAWLVRIWTGDALQPIGNDGDCPSGGRV